MFGSRYPPCCDDEQIVLSFEGVSSSATEEGEISTLAVPHDSSAEDMKEAILSLAAKSFDGFVGELDVSREVNGAEGLEVYRYVSKPQPNCNASSDDYDTVLAVLILISTRCVFGRKPATVRPQRIIIQRALSCHPPFVSWDTCSFERYPVHVVDAPLLRSKARYKHSILESSCRCA